MPLTQLKIQHAKPKEKPYKLGDSGGLFLLVTPAGNKLWRFKYRFLNKEKVLAIGQYPDLSLAEARDERDAARKLNAKGIDPNEHKKEKRKIAAQNDSNTFEHIAREWHEWKGASKSAYYAKQIIQRLEKDVFPKIGHRPISSISAADLLKIVRAIEDRGALEMTHRAMQICGEVFRYAIVTERAERNPAADLRGFLKTPEKKHRAYISKQELPAFLKKFEAYNGSDTTKLALKLLMLTMVRPGELCGARWSEIDLDNAEWLIPAERMKMRTTHLVPLSKQACEILSTLKRLQRRNSDFVFPNERSAMRGMATSTLLFALYTIGYKDKATSHGFRATASTILNESGLFAEDVVERQLAHQERNRIRAAYNHAEHLPARRKMIQWWADYLDKAAA